MRLITSLRISGFRSLREERVDSFGELSAFIGKNSSGKSNILRSLNLFFNNEVEPGEAIDWNRDFNQYAARVSRRKRRIEVSVGFSLPQSFRFRKELVPTKELLEREPELVITKLWEPDNEVRILLNGRELQIDDTNKIIQFLNLIKFRYIPNRVLPFSIIEEEQDSLAKRLVKRLALRKEGTTNAFQQLKQQAAELSTRLADVFDAASPDTKIVQLNTPEDWEDVLFILGYSFISKHNEKVSTSGELEGAGNQSLLMLETLRLIDADYSMSFGWRQATIWAYEEPESSLHYSLEALVSTKLRSYANHSEERLQVVISTHSNLFAENADAVYHVEKKAGETSIMKIESESMNAGHFSKHGITRYSHPLLFFPRKTLVLLEGKFDYLILSKLKPFLSFSENVEFTYIEKMSEVDGETGGDNQILTYIKSYRSLIESRFEEFPLIALVDWDSGTIFKRLTDLSKKMSRLKPIIWPQSDLNPELSPDFKGLERALGTPLVERAALTCGVNLSHRKKVKGYCFDPRDKEELKREIWRTALAETSFEDFKIIQSTAERIIGDLVKKNRQPTLV